MNYNTQREKMAMSEYGRAVQDMVNYALTLENREERQRCAQTIVNVMGNMQPALRDQPDHKHKLWDHLAYISGYQLDVDYPYPVTRLDSEATKPTPLHYPQNRIRNRHYGHITELFLEHLATMPEGEERDALTEDLANQMKQELYDWNRDAMDGQNIAADIARYTDGRVRLDLTEFKFDNVIQGSQQSSGKKRKKKK